MVSPKTRVTLQWPYVDTIEVVKVNTKQMVKVRPVVTPMSRPRILALV